jgi:hypothetical protein
VADPGEAIDLAGSMPEKLQQMILAYESYASSNGVLEVPKGYRQQAQVGLNGLRDRLGPQILIILLSILVLVFVLVLRTAKRK